MHEYGIVQDLIRQAERVARTHGAVRVAGLRVAIGALSGVDPELLRLAFESFRASSGCAEAGLEVRSVPTAWACSACGAQIATGEVLRCGPCGAPARLVAGSEIVLERVDLEVPELDSPEPGAPSPELGGLHV